MPTILHRPRNSSALILILLWILTVAGVARWLPAPLASWLTFLSLLITPGYLLGDLLLVRQRLDLIERLAIALPLGITLLALPGLAALLLHTSIDWLALGWLASSGIVLLRWLFLRGRTAPLAGRAWTRHERLLVGALALLFLAILPVISLHKIDGDTYAVSTFTADALAGLPLHRVEPLFGTELGPGVRMLFNQSLPLSYLWSYFSGVDPIPLASSLARGPFALWILLAAYTLGYAATGRRRTALLVASFQFLIFLSAPFLRGDNISLFFFERTDADKFMVPMALLPVVVALTLRYVRSGRHDLWRVAALATLAVSAIHPLIAAMLALALGAFGALHLLLARRSALPRVAGLGALVLLVMLLPLIQLVMARGAAPLAPSYPSSFDGWPFATQRLPVLPGIEIPVLQLVGNTPDLAALSADDALAPDSPFLLWRFAVNMDRRRLLFFDHDHYLSDPSLLFEPPYLLALLLLPLLWRRRRTLGAQYALATTFAILFVMFNPLLTPLIGDLVMPWILWRFVWLLPTALILALGWEMALVALHRWQRRQRPALARPSPASAQLLSLTLCALLLAPLIARNLSILQQRSPSPDRFPAPTALYERLSEALGARSATIMADPAISVTLPAYVATAAIVAHRVPTTSEIFPATQQPLALQRLIDQEAFYHSAWLTAESIAILARYQIEYIVVESGTAMESQLRLAPDAFPWLLDEAGYSLYQVVALPAAGSATVQGNSAMAERRWDDAAAAYQQALERSPDDLMAQLGLAQLDQIQGSFAVALERLETVTQQHPSAPLFARLGQLQATRGDLDGAISAYRAALQQAPAVPHYHIALGNICWRAGESDCTSEQYAEAVALQQLPDRATRLMAEGDLWRAQGAWPMAIERFAAAVELTGSEYNRFVLAGALEEAGRNDEAAAVIAEQRRRAPLSASARVAQARLLARQGQIDAAVVEYQAAIRLQRLLLESPITTLQALAQTLLDAGRLDEAEQSINQALALRPEEAATLQLLGTLQQRRGDSSAATDTYRRALALDGRRLAVLFALRDESRRTGEAASTLIPLLEAASRQNPDDPTLALLVGDEWQRQGESEHAIAAYQLAIQSLTPDQLGPTTDPQGFALTSAFAAVRLAESYDALAQPDAALNYYRAAVASAPTVAWPHVQLADALRRADDPQQAEALYRRAIELEPTYLDSYLRLADLFMAQGKPEQATALYDDVAQQTATLASPLGPLRPSLLTLDRPVAESGSDETMDRSPEAASAIVAPPSDETASRNQALATVYERQGKLAEARALIEQLLGDEVPPLLRARYAKRLGDLYLGEGDMASARVAYEQALAWDSGAAATRLSLAQVLILSGNREAALTQLERAALLAPGSVDVQLALADLLAEQGDMERAGALVAQLAERQPGTTRAVLGHAQLLTEGGEWQAAELQFQRAISLHPGESASYLAYAEFLILRGRFDEADGQLREALRRDLGNSAIYLRLSDVALQRGQPDEAAQWHSQASERVASDQALESALLDRYVDSGQFPEALSLAETLLTSHPASIELLRRTAQLYTRAGDHVRAEALLLRATALAPQSPRLLSALGEALRAQDRLAEAQQSYEEAIRLAPLESSYYLSLSEIQQARGDADGAVATLASGLATVPTADELAVARATLQQQLGQAEAARSTLEAASTNRPESIPLLLALGEWHRRNGDLEGARSLIDQALVLEPQEPAPHLALGALLRQQGRGEESLAAYDAARTAAPTNAVSYLALADGYMAAGQISEAQAALERAITLAPAMTEGYLRLGTLHEQSDNTAAAAAIYDQGLAALPSSGRLYVAYAALLQANGQPEQAGRLLEQSVERSPTADTLIARASYYRANGQAEAARADLHRALQQQPGAVQALLLLGDLAREEGERTRAKELYERAMAQQPGSATAYLRLAGLALDVGDRAEAERLQATARSLEPTIGEVTAP